MNETLQNIITRRSVKKYKDTSVPEALVRAIAEAHEPTVAPDNISNQPPTARQAQPHECRNPRYNRRPVLRRTRSIGSPGAERHQHPRLRRLAGNGKPYAGSPQSGTGSMLDSPRQRRVRKRRRAADTARPRHYRRIRRNRTLRIGLSRRRRGKTPDAAQRRLYRVGKITHAKKTNRHPVCESHPWLKTPPQKVFP